MGLSSTFSHIFLVSVLIQNSVLSRCVIRKTSQNWWFLDFFVRFFIICVLLHYTEDKLRGGVIFGTSPRVSWFFCSVIRKSEHKNFYLLFQHLSAKFQLPFRLNLCSCDDQRFFFCDEARFFFGLSIICLCDKPSVSRASRAVSFFGFVLSMNTKFFAKLVYFALKI